jgi:hypothetical protein
MTTSTDFGEENMSVSKHNPSSSVMNVAFNIVVVVTFIFPTGIVSASSSQALPMSANVRANPYQAPQYIHPLPRTQLGYVTLDSTEPGSKTASLAPIMFIQNVGQFDKRVRFQGQSGDTTIFITDNSIWLNILGKPKSISDPKEKLKDRKSDLEKNTTQRGVNIRLDFVGANNSAKLEPFGKIDTSYSYFMGSDPSAWQKDVPVWRGIRVVDIYPGLDLVIYNDNQQWAWEFSIRDASIFYSKNNSLIQQGIRMKVSGDSGLSMNEDLLQISTALGNLDLPILSFRNASKSMQQLQRGGAPQIHDKEFIIPIPLESTSFIPNNKFSTAFTSGINPGNNAFLMKKSSLLAKTMFNQNNYSSPALTSDDLLIYSAIISNQYADLISANAVDQDGAVYFQLKWDYIYPILCMIGMLIRLR